MRELFGGTIPTMVIPAPARPSIFHIVHFDRLESIMADGGLHCDATMANRPAVGTTIGMSNIKERRLAWGVPCHPETCVGDYVPFYFCQRSVMLHRIHVNQGKDDDPDLAYERGQEGIVHLEADLRRVVDWAQTNGQRWAFSTANAASAIADFHTDLSQLNAIDWGAVQTNDWSDVRAAKQAEFLMHGFFPWNLIYRIGVYSNNIRLRVGDLVREATHKPRVTVMRHWYY